MRAVPRLCNFSPGFCLTTEEKARKNLSHGKKNLSQIKKNLSQSTEKPQSKYTVQYAYYQKHPHITKPSQTHTLQNPLIHTLQNNIKPPQYELKRNALLHSVSVFSQILHCLLYSVFTSFAKVIANILNNYFCPTRNVRWVWMFQALMSFGWC